MNKVVHSAIERRAFRSTLFGFIQFSLTFIQSILLVPLLLSHWGREKYGIYIAVFAFIQLLRTLDFGHQAYIGNEFNKKYFIDKEKAMAIFASSIKMAFVLGGLELVLFIVLWATGFAYPIIGVGVFHSSLEMLGILSMIVMWWMLGSATGVAARAVLTHGLYAETVVWAIALKVIEILFLVCAGIFNLSLFNILWIWALINLVYTFFAARWALKHLMKFDLIWKTGTWRLAFYGLRNSIVLTVNNGLEQLNSNGIIFLITRFISVAMLPVYSTLRTITNMAVQFTSLIISPMQPELIRYHSEKAGDKIYSVIQTVWIINGLIVNISLMAAIPIISWLFHIWTKGILPFDEKLFFLLCTSTSIANFGKILIAYLTGINDLKSITLISTTKCVLLFCFSLGLLPYFGMLSIGYAFLVAEIVSSVLLPVFLTREKLAELNCEVKALDVVLALIPIFILSLCFIIQIVFQYYPFLIALVGIIITGIVYTIYWKRLHIEVRLRLKTLTLKIVRRGQNIVLWR